MAWGYRGPWPIAHEFLGGGGNEKDRGPNWTYLFCRLGLTSLVERV